MGAHPSILSTPPCPPPTTQRADFSLKPIEWNDELVLYPETFALRQQNPNLKISIAVGGWSMNEVCRAVLMGRVAMHVSVCLQCPSHVMRQGPAILNRTASPRHNCPPPALEPLRQPVFQCGQARQPGLLHLQGDGIPRQVGL